MGEQDEATLEDSKRWFCRWLVALIVNVQVFDDQGRPFRGIQHFVCSSIIMSVRGVWYLVTAGHSLEWLRDQEKKGVLKIEGASIADGFGLDAVDQHPIPFEGFDEAPQFTIHQDGIDCAAIALQNHYVELLKKNKVQPIYEATWKELAKANLAKGGFIIGFPERDVETILSFDGKTESLKLAVSFLPVTAVDPDEVPEEFRTEHPRIPLRYHAADFKPSMKGMSGGPIIAFDMERREIWIVGIQSGYLEHGPLLAFACPLFVIGGILEGFTDGLFPDEGPPEAPVE